MVAVPTLLLNEAQVRDLVLDLEIRFLANRDPNLYFALLTDSPDSDRSRGRARRPGGRLPQADRRTERRYRRRLAVLPVSPPPRLQRVGRPLDGLGAQARQTARSESAAARRLRRVSGEGGRPVGACRASATSSRSIPTRSLPRDSAAKLIGAIAHPLNRGRRGSARRKMVVEGYGILQPRIGISMQSAARSRLAALYSGETGFDIYTRAVSDVYQDLFGEGIFTGKGIYEVDALRDVLERRFPENALLSHDLIEGAYARAALVTDIELIDDYPSHFSAYSRRKHRWVRGDWQILRWIQPRVPDFYGTHDRRIRSL